MQLKKFALVISLFLAGLSAPALGQDAGLWMHAEARYLANAGQLQQAERAFFAARELGSQRGEVVEIFYLRLASNDRDGAAALLDQYPTEFPNLPLLRAGLRVLSGRPEPQARTIWQTTNSEESPQGLFWRGILGECLGEREAALEDLRTAVRDPAVEQLAREGLQRLHGPTTCTLCRNLPGRYWCGEAGSFCPACWARLSDPSFVSSNLNLPKTPFDEPVKLVVRPFSEKELLRAYASVKGMPRARSSAQLFKAILPNEPPPTDPGWVLQTAWWFEQLMPNPTRQPTLKRWVAYAAAIAQSTSSQRQEAACSLLLVCSRRLNANQRKSFAKLQADRPHDLFLRILTLEGNPEGLLWLVEHRPELSFASHEAFLTSPQLQLRLMRAWHSQVEKHADNAPVLGSAARFFQLQSNEITNALYLRCLQIEPKNPYWCEQLAHSLELSAEDLPSRREALRFLERALELGGNRGYLLTSLVKLSIDAGETTRAKAWAEELLATPPGGWNEGNAKHHAHLALGRLALRQDDRPTAARQLLAAAQGPTSPQLASFGPNMQLALELLKAGDRPTVVQYLEACKKIWETGIPQLDTWIAEIETGVTPDFGANLNY